MNRVISLGLMLLGVACQKTPESSTTPTETTTSPGFFQKALSPSCQAVYSCCEEFSARVAKGGKAPFNCTALATQGPEGCEQSLQTFRALSPKVKAQLPSACTQ